MTGIPKSALPPLALAAVRQSIVAAIARNEWFSDIVKKHNVAPDAVAALAYEPDTTGLCGGCGASGKVEGQSGDGIAAPCPTCKGKGYTRLWQASCA